MPHVVRNVGSLDAMVRGVLSVMLLLAAAAFSQRPFLALAAGILAVVVLLSALTHSCPLYTLLGVTTCPVEPRAPAGGKSA